MVSRFGTIIAVIASAMGAELSETPAVAQTQTLTLCGQKVDYNPATTEADASSSMRTLPGIWLGEEVALNVAYGVDYKRCIAVVIERVDADGKVFAKVVWGDSAKVIQTGASYGTKAIVANWNGKLFYDTLRFESTDKKTVYEFRLSAASKMEGSCASPQHKGRVFLTRK